MNRSLTRLIVLIGGLTLAASGFLSSRASAQTDLQPASAVQAFLYPPYPGAASQESIFDHTSPNYTDTDKIIVTFNGHRASKICPRPAPAGTPPPQSGVCDYGYGIYWSYSLGGWVGYNGHDGIDYGMSYRPLYAASNADQVVYAGWYDPQNHKSNLGIYVKLHHPNGYYTAYGHMSAVAVQTCNAPGCVNLSRGEVIGFSGNTGNSTGPHLHFIVKDSSNRSVDPYGWSGSGTDPLSYGQRESLWVQNPSVVYYSSQILPTGAALAYPPAVTGGIVVDDTGAGFAESPTGCWKIAVTGGSQNGSFRYVTARSSAANCFAAWGFPENAAAGVYAVYVRIPPIHATTEGALYNIVHAGETDRATVNQQVFPNSFYVTDGWVYVGKYEFNGNGNEYVALSNQTHDPSGVVSSLEVGADAVRFVYVSDSTITPPAPVTPSKTPTPTITRTPTSTRTPTITRTPTFTRTPTRTRTPSRTPTSSRTPTNTSTPRPTATPQWTLARVYFASQYRFTYNIPPIEVYGVRWIRTSSFMGPDLLKEFFKGPGNTEYFYYGWRAIYNGFTGYSKVDLVGNTAHVYLTGTCEPNGSEFTIADQISLTLKQFPNVQYVKIYDQFGQTADMNGLGDSEPLCLDPGFVPSPTATVSLTPSQTPSPTRTPTLTPTPTLTRTPTRTRTPTNTPRPTDTRRPTLTPQWTLAKVFFVDKYRFDNHITPYEVNGVRWVKTSPYMGMDVLKEFFKGPGNTEYFYYGWRAVYNGFTGYSKVEFSGDLVRVYLTGVCAPERTDFTIADLIMLNLKQFPDVQFVKIFDENGVTEFPEGEVDSIPLCLKP